MDEEPKLHYSTTFWSSALGRVPFQIIVANYPSLWKAWWTMTKEIWKARHKLRTLGDLEERADPTKVASGEHPTITTE